MTQIFEVTKQHLKLLRNFQIGWQNCEFGAPEIDPKRPYGNSDVVEDIAVILGIEPDHKACMKIHKETQTALEIALQTGKFKAGEYIRRKTWDTWKLIGADK